MRMDTTEPDSSEDPVHERKQELKTTPTEETIIQTLERLVMPDCIERRVVTLLCYLQLKILNEGHVQIQDNSIEMDVQYLKENLNKDQLKQFQRVFECINVRNYQEAAEKLAIILKEIRPFDVQECLRLVQLSNNSVACIQGQEIILLFGETGAGKSTTIHFLAGSKMQKVLVNKLNHIAPMEIKNPALKSVTTSNASKSETRYITAVPVDLKDLGNFRSINYSLCDTPGLGDTAGCEVDVANSIGIVNAVKACNTVRPVITFGYRGLGNRMQSFTRLLHIIVGMIPDINDHMRAFSYIFTRFPDYEKNQIQHMLESVYNENSSLVQSDQAYSRFLLDMIDKVCPECVVDPIVDNPLKLMKVITAREPIRHPEEVFRVAMTPESSAAIRNQMQKNYINIIAACDKGHFDYIAYKLTEMKQLHQVIQDELVQNVIIDCIAHVSKAVHSRYTSTLTLLNDVLSRQTSLGQHIINEYKKGMEFLQESEKLRNHLGSSVPCGDDLLRNLTDRVQKLCESVKEKELKDTTVLTTMDNLILLSQSFQSIVGEHYQQTRDLIVDKFNSLGENAKKALLNNDFDLFGSELTRIVDGATIMKDHVDYEQIMCQYKDLVKLVETNIQNIILTKVPELAQDSLKNIKELQQFDAILSNMQTSLHLQQHVCSTVIRSLIALFCDSIENVWDKLHDDITRLFDTDSLIAFADSKILMAQMSMLDSLSTPSSRLSKKYYGVIEELSSHLLAAWRTAETELRKMQEEEPVHSTSSIAWNTGTAQSRQYGIDYNRMATKLLAVKNAEWLESYRHGAYSNGVNDIENLLTDHFGELQVSIENAPVYLTEIDKLMGSLRILEQLKRPNVVKLLTTDYPKVGEICTKLLQGFIARVESVLISIQNMYTQENIEAVYNSFHPATALKQLKYIGTCNSSQLVRDSAVNVRMIFDEFMRKYATYVKNEIHRAFNNIVNLREDTVDNSLFDDSIKLTSMLNQVSILESEPKYDELFVHFDQTVLSDFIRILDNKWIRLRDDLQSSLESGDHQRFRLKLAVAKYLSICDKYITKSYDQLYTSNQDLMNNQISQTQKTLLDLCSQHAYPQIALTLSQLRHVGSTHQTSGIYNQAIQTVLTHLGILVRETNNKAVTLPDKLTSFKGPVMEVISNVKHMDSAYRDIAQFLDIKLQEQLNTEIQRVIIAINLKMARFINRIEKLIGASDFDEAYRQQQAVGDICGILGEYCLTENADRIGGLEKLIDKEFNSIVDVYSQMEVTEYSRKPPREIIENLNKMMQTQIAERIVNSVRERVRDEIEEAKKSENVTVRLRRMEAILKSTLPQTLQDQLIPDIQAARDYVADRKSFAEEAIRTAVSLDNTVTLQSYLCDHDSIIQRYARQMILDKVSKVNPDFVPSDNIHNAWQELRTLFMYAKAFQAIIPEIKNMFEKANQNCKQVYESSQKRCLKLESSDSSAISNSFVASVMEDIAVLEVFETMYRQDVANHNGIMAKEVLGTEFLNTMNYLHQRMCNVIVKINTRIQKAIANRDITGIHNDLSQIQAWEAIRSRLVEKCNPNPVPKPFSEIVAHFVEILKELHNEILATELLNDETKRCEKSRDALYTDLCNKILFLRKAQKLQCFIDEMDLNIVDLETQCIESLRKKADLLFSSIQRIIDHRTELRKEDYNTINHTYSNLVVFKKYFTSTFNIESQEATVNENLLGRVEQIVQSVEVNITNVSLVAEKLILLQEMSDGIIAFKEHISNEIGHVIDMYLRRTSKSKGIATLGSILDRCKKGVGQVILLRSCFKGYSNSLFQSRTKNQGIDYVLKHLEYEGVQIDSSQLRDRYDEFDVLYTNVVKQYLDKDNSKVSELISNIKMEVGRALVGSKELTWNSNMKNAVPKLLAYIFALWTLNNSDYYFESGNEKDYLLCPHSAQVISIFRMLGIGDQCDGILQFLKISKRKPTELLNNLVQIGTGEGKSITLAVTSCVLALFGYDVMCACYSDYLSKRDYKEFEKMFHSLGLADRIHYGTFNALCERVINQEGNVRELVESCIGNSNNQTNIRQQQSKQRPSILLIDEVDVFFNKSFYGNEYIPSATLKHTTITELVDLIWKGQKRWKQIKTKKAYDEIKKSTEYLNCVAVYKDWEFLIDEATKDMLADLNSFESHDYIVQDDRIGYKEQDGVSFNIVYGYKTMFAYLHEAAKGTISQTSLENHIAISISCGEFSYAEIPMQFKYIMGVTGTLKTLTDPEREIVKDRFQVLKHTYIPSVFGENNNRFSQDKDISISKKEQYTLTLAKEINDRLQGNTVGTKRAVFVFFETMQRLDEFFKSSHFSSHKDDALVITEELSSLEKESAINRASSSGKVTLLTRVFGRGTDFVCRDEIVKSNGGVHVIQTFLSEELSEETQIRGRTARQGSMGSYSMHLCEEDLEKFGIGQPELTEMKNKASYYSVLDQKRREYFKKQYSGTDKHVQELKQKHEATRAFVTAVLNNQISQAKQFLKEQNKGAPLENLSRTLALMDATGSMSHLLHNAKNTVGSMFERAAAVLVDQGIEPNMFEMQFAVYRNYNAPEDSLLQCSPWESKPGNLRSFMETIKPEYGWGNEAIEIALWHANQEIKKNVDVSQIILIGDAAANTDEEVDIKRKLKGETYWAGTKFSQRTLLGAELGALVKNQIKVHSFYVNQYAEPCFQSIADATKGRCEFLDINSENGAELLTNLVTEEVLRNVGGEQRGDSLVNRYRELNTKKTYTL